MLLIHSSAEPGSSCSVVALSAGSPCSRGLASPLSAVEAYLRRGLPDERILKAFPVLTEADIEAARRTLASA